MAVTLFFGASSVWDIITDLTDLPSDQEDHSFEDAVSKLVSDSKLHDGRKHVAGRISLSQAPKFKTDALDGLSAEQRHTLHEALVKVSRENQGSAKVSPTDLVPDVHDALDAALTEEMLGKLPKAVDRAVRLEMLSLDLIPDEAVKGYFEEAHRCYLYGFHVACAVLCRAILASALENLCDPRRQLYARTARRDSYFKILVEKARVDGLLTDDRPEWAIRVRDAGNDAVHDFSKFTQRWRGKLDEVLLNTRKVLLDLYKGPKQT
jgi:hypothetical protein